VVDYLITHAYLNTAQSLAGTDTRPSKPEDDEVEDGDVEMVETGTGSSTNIKLDQETISGIERRRSEFSLEAGIDADDRYH
jgi:hypothetical protein